MTTEEQRDVLRKAKGVLLTQGWRNDGRFGGDCKGQSVCLAGAIGTVLWDDPWGFVDYDDHPLLALVAPLCPPWAAAHEGPTLWTLFNFNDDYASFEDIIDLLDRAIASLEPSKTPELVA